MLEASCHCGAVRIEVPRTPERLTDCNCSICRRYGVLWAYYDRAEVEITCASGATHEYAWGEKSLKFVRCATCGCVTHWEALDPARGTRMGVNARLFDPASMVGVRVRALDGASTWEYID